MKKLIPIIALSIFMNIFGSWWAGPDNERVGLVFGNKETMKVFSGEMVKSRGDLYKGIQYYDQAQQYEDRRIIIRGKDGTVLETSRTLIDAARSFLLRSYAPDEQATLKALSNMNPSKLDFNPGFFLYGGLYLYPLGIFMKIMSLFGVIKTSPDISNYFQYPEQMGLIFMYGKIFGAVFASLAVFFMYLAGSALYGKKIGLIASLIFSVTPAVVVWSHYLNPYTYTLFWMMLSFFLCLKLFDKNETKYYILAGLSAGLTTGCLTLYGFILLSIPVIQYLKNSKKGFRPALLSLFSKNMWLASLFFFAGFFVVNPYWLINFKQVVSEFTKAVPYYPFKFSFTSIYNYLCHIMLAAFGLPAWIMAVCGFLYAALKRRQEDILLLLLVSAAVVYFSCSMTHYMHYGLFIIPLLILLGARFIDFLLRSGKALKVAGTLLLAVVAIYSFSYSLSIDIAASRKNTRTVAGEWINRNIPAGATIGLTELPSPWRTPPFSFFDYRMLITGFDETTLGKEMPEYFIMEEHQWLRGYTYKRMLSFLKDYEEYRRFEDYPRVLGMEFRRDDNAPYDWPDINPVILIFKRKAAN